MEASATGPGFRTTRQQRLRAALDRRDALEQAVVVLKQEQTEVERKAYDPRWADMSDPEPAARAVKDKAEERTLAEQRADAARAELLEIAAGPCGLRERPPLLDQPVRAASMQATPRSSHLNTTAEEKPPPTNKPGNTVKPISNSKMTTS